ncbi:MAG: hypothetical protein ISQ25_05570 [Rhodobacteraceae bacterium]|nr:hypothetical protein [Paracoccaceae bacterium]
MIPRPVIDISLSVFAHAHTFAPREQLSVERLTVPPNEKPLTHKSWEKPHEENRTGSALAYAPAGSLRKSVPQDRQDYEAWKPE